MPLYKGLHNCSARHYKFILFLQKLRIQEILIIDGGYWLLMSNRENPCMNAMVWLHIHVRFFSTILFPFKKRKIIINCDCSCTVLMKLQPISLFWWSKKFCLHNKAVATMKLGKKTGKLIKLCCKIRVIWLIQETLFSRRSNWLKPTRS